MPCGRRSIYSPLLVPRLSLLRSQPAQMASPEDGLSTDHNLSGELGALDSQPPQNQKFATYRLAAI